MIRRFAPWFGAFVLVLAAAFLAAFGRGAALEPTIALFLLGFTVAGVLSIVGGVVEAIPIGSRTVPWHALVGTSYIVLALVTVLLGIRTVVAGDGGTEAALTAVAMLVGGASLGWFGRSIALDSRHVDLEASPSPRRLAAIVALAVLSFGIGVLVTTRIG